MFISVYVSLVRLSSFPFLLRPQFPFAHSHSLLIWWRERLFSRENRIKSQRCIFLLTKVLHLTVVVPLAEYQLLAAGSHSMLCLFLLFTQWHRAVLSHIDKLSAPVFYLTTATARSHTTTTRTLQEAALFTTSQFLTNHILLSLGFITDWLIASRRWQTCRQSLIRLYYVTFLIYASLCKLTLKTSPRGLHLWLINPVYNLLRFQVNIWFSYYVPIA